MSQLSPSLAEGGGHGGRGAAVDAVAAVGGEVSLAGGAFDGARGSALVDGAILSIELLEFVHEHLIGPAGFAFEESPKGLVDHGEMAEAIVETLEPAVRFVGSALGTVGIDGEIGDAHVLAKVFEEHGGRAFDLTPSPTPTLSPTRVGDGVGDGIGREL